MILSLLAYPMRRYFTDRLVRACSELPKMCEFFHIPFQSGDDDILRDMRWDTFGCLYLPSHSFLLQAHVQG